MAQETIGRYPVVDVLRREPLGRVALCQDPDNDEYVLGKELFTPRRLDADKQQELTFRFRLAMRVVQEAQGSEFVPLLAWGPQANDSGPQDPHFAVFELPTGETLADACREGRSFTPTQAFQIVDQCAAALQVLQDNDIAPSAVDIRNVFLTDEGQTRWAELGFAHYLPEVDESFAERSPDGFRFQSPEELKRNPRTTASLVYSLGAVLYRLLTGEPPYEGDTAVAVLLTMAKKELEPLRNRMTDVPGGADDLIAKALAREPDERFPTVAEFRNALQPMLSGVNPELEQEQEQETAAVPEEDEKPTTKPRKFALPSWKLLAAGGVVVLLAFVSLLVLRKPAPSPSPRQQRPAAQQPGKQPTPAAMPGAAKPQAPTPSPPSAAPKKPAPPRVRRQTSGRQRTRPTPARTRRRPTRRAVSGMPSLAPTTPTASTMIPEAKPAAPPPERAGGPPAQLPPGVKQRF